MHANAAQSKSCRACRKSGHMSASCNVDKTKLNCTYCKTKGSHITYACPKKKKASKNKETSKERNKKKNESKDDPQPPGEPSNTAKRTNLTSFKNKHTNSQESFHNLCVQLRLREDMDSGDTDSDNESYTTPPESNQEEEIITVDEEDNMDDPINPNTADIMDDES